MSMISLAALQVGDSIPSYTTKPITRRTLALYAGASGDYNPIHIDIDFAKAAGMDDVFAHGMLSMAYLGRLLTDALPQQALREFSVRFVAITHVGDTLTCAGAVTEKFERDGEPLARLQLTATDQRGEVKLQGEAILSLR